MFSSTTASNVIATTSNATLTLNQIQQQIQQHELLKRLQIVNKQLSLLRANPSNNASSIPLLTVTNLISTVATVMPTTSNYANSKEPKKKGRKHLFNILNILN